MDRIIEYSYYPWGPFLYKTKLFSEEIKQIKLLFKKDKKKDYRKNLAGLLKEEYEINEKKLFPIISPYINGYTKAYINYTGSTKIIHTDKIKLKKSWVNFMKKNESNPMHTHDNDLSFVLYTQIPKGLPKEYRSTLSTSKPGNINFVINYGIKNSICSHSFFPEVGDFYIFPANLVHYVNPFTCKGERISVSGNLSYV
tara:strand:+ start:700 stop:1293 length:594 start_codon:yes stop_codon:yes gene_type:complete